MISQKTARHVLRAAAEIDKALGTNRLKGWERMPIIEISVKLDKYVKDNGLIAENKGSK